MSSRPDRSSMPAYLATSKVEEFLPEPTPNTNRRSLTPVTVLRERSKSGDEVSKSKRRSMPAESGRQELKKTYRAPAPPIKRSASTVAARAASPDSRKQNRRSFIPDVGQSLPETKLPHGLLLTSAPSNTNLPLAAVETSPPMRSQPSSSSSCSSTTDGSVVDDPEASPQETNTANINEVAPALSSLLALGKPALAFLTFRSSSSSAKSAPTTPHGDWSPCSAASPTNPTTSIASNTTPPKSPSNSAGKHDKTDRQNLKQLSVSAPPQMTQAPQQPPKSGDGAPAATTPAAIPLTPTLDEPGSSKSRQKKFHRHFKQVAQEERVLNYYSCALVADILLQGQLYITKNYFAFYSNVFGYVTKLLIPTVSVLKISKEKTARIIPNAVGIETVEDKHVFGSLLSRDATYRLMIQVWKAATGPEPVEDLLREEEPEKGYESSQSGSEQSVVIPPSSPVISKLRSTGHVDVNRLSYVGSVPPNEISTGTKIDKTEPELTSNDRRSVVSQPTRLLVISTVLLVFLFLSAAVLLYRISLIQSQFNDNPLLSGSDQVYQEILKWQAQLHTRSTNEVQEFLSSNLDQLAKVRKSLEALSLLLLRNEERTARDRQQNYDATLLRNGNS